MNQDIIDFYRAVRSDDAIIAALAVAKTPEDMAALAVHEGERLGFHFSTEAAKAAVMDLNGLCAKAVNDDELNDFELEMIAAGAPPSHTSNDL